MIELNSVPVFAEIAYRKIKESTEGFDAIYEDYILNEIGKFGLIALKENRLIEACGVVNGRQLYTLCK